MMKILLVDVDSKIPNIALGKLSTYYKSKGCIVTYIKLNLAGWKKNEIVKTIDADEYDKVFVSNIFIANRNKFKVVNCDDVSIGGVGSINPHSRLPDNIHQAEVDYSLWPENDKSYGFITRGCIRKCKFCLVPDIEGKLRFENHLSTIIRHKKVIFLDNNILAYKGHKDILKAIIDWDIICQFNQGLDIRLLNEENMKLLSQVRYFFKYNFAFDDIKYMNAVERGEKLFRKYIKTNYRMLFLVYYSSKNPLADLITRAEWCKRHKAFAFIMRDADCASSIYEDFIKLYYQYVSNTRGFFFKMSFGQFLFKEQIPKDRMLSTMDIYKRALKGEI